MYNTFSLLNKVSIILFILGISPSSLSSQQMWSRTYGGHASARANSVIETTDQNYLVAGAKFSDFYLLKIDYAGDTLWTKTIGGGSQEEAYSIIETADGGYLSAGFIVSSSINYFLVKTDNSGSLEWSREYVRDGDNYDDWAYSLIQTSDNSFLLGGTSIAPGPFSSDFWIIKTDLEGDTLWTKTFGLGAFTFSRCNAVVEAENGDYLAVGNFNQSSGALRLDANGNILWSRNYSGDDVLSAIALEDGGFVLAGKGYPSINAQSDVWLTRIDSSGDVIWTKTYGNDGSDQAIAMTHTFGDAYAVTGELDGNYWILKIDHQGDTLWTQTHGGDQYDGPRAIISTSDAGYLIAGSTNSFSSSNGDIWLVKTDQFGLSESTVSTWTKPVVLNKGSLLSYPNPSNNECKIQYTLPKQSDVQLAIYDLRGREIFSLNYLSQFHGKYTYSWDAKSTDGSEIQSGVYVISVSTDFWSESQKIVITK